jgi:hypothetical protein
VGCNCGAKNQKFKYIYTDTSGKQSTWDSKIAAEAAKVRAGGGGSIRQEPK